MENKRNNFNLERTENILYFAQKMHKFKLPHAMKVYLFTTQLCLGFNMGISEAITRSREKTILKLFTSLMCIIMTFVIISPIAFKEIWYWTSIVKYIAFITVLNLSKYKLWDFLNDIHGIDESIPLIKKNVFVYLIILYTYGIQFLNYIFINLRCINVHNHFCFEMSNLHRAFHSFVLQGTDSIGSLQIIMIFYIYIFVRHMRYLFESENNLEKLEQRYIAIASIYDRYKNLYQSAILIELFINTPRLMVTLWCMLLYIKENAEWYSYTSEWLFAFHLTIQMCIPAVIAEMLNCQMDSIKLMMNEQLRVEKDKEKSDDIIRILRYIKARRLQNDIWRVIPVDLRLPLSLFSLCTTYFIVILQFTHLYD